MSQDQKSFLSEIDTTIPSTIPLTFDNSISANSTDHGIVLNKRSRTIKKKVESKPKKIIQRKPKVHIPMEDQVKIGSKIVCEINGFDCTTKEIYTVIENICTRPAGYRLPLVYTKREGSGENDCDRLYYRVLPGTGGKRGWALQRKFEKGEKWYIMRN